MIESLISATDEALRSIAEPRFWQTERGFQGRFYCALQRALETRGHLENGYILEMEYQKSARHGIFQRPDIVLHMPAEDFGAAVNENNLAVWALKRQATDGDATRDFEKLEEMFQALRYSVGIFVNISSTDHFAGAYSGYFPERLRTVAVSKEAEVIVITWGSPGS